MATTKIAATKITTTTGKGFAADAETLKNAATKPMRTASKAAKPAAAKSVAKVEPKRVVNRLAPNPKPGIPVITVKNVGELTLELGKFPKANRFSSNMAFATEIISIINVRGRLVAEIHRAK